MPAERHPEGRLLVRCARPERVTTGGNDAWFDDEVGYRVDRAAYALPEVSFTPDELAVLGLASRVWQQARPGRPGRGLPARRG